MNYKVLQVKHKWAVIETRSGLVIEYHKTPDAARKQGKSLNKGRGFDGWSPTFMTTREKI